MFIRPARPADLEDLVRVHCEAWHDSHSDLFPDWFMQTRNEELFHQRWTRFLSDQDNPVLVAVRDDQIIGFVRYGLPSPEKPAGIGEIHKVYLAASARGGGVGAALLREGERGLAELGYSEGFLAVAADHPGAVGFYRRQGWRELGEPWVQEFEGVSVRVQDMAKALHVEPSP